MNDNFKIFYIYFISKFSYLSQIFFSFSSTFFIILSFIIKSSVFSIGFEVLTRIVSHFIWIETRYDVISIFFSSLKTSIIEFQILDFITKLSKFFLFIDFDSCIRKKLSFLRPILRRLTPKGERQESSLYYLGSYIKYIPTFAGMTVTKLLSQTLIFVFLSLSIFL